MNEFDIKNKINDESKTYVVKTSSSQIIEKYNKKHEPKTNFNWRKIFTYASPVLAVAAILAVVLPTTLNKNGNPTSVITPTETGLLSKEKVNKLAFEATTASQAAMNLANPMSSLSKRAITQTEKDELKETLPAIDLILTNKSSFESTLTTSSNPDYDYQLNISYIDVDDSSISYTLQFDVIESRVEHDEDEVEKTVIYKGISIVGDSTFDFVATLEEETEQNESETEISMTLYKDASKKDFIKVSQSNETEGTEFEESFEYEVYNNSRLVNEFEISTELNRNKQEIELELNENEYKVEIISNFDSTKFKFSRENEPNDFVVFEKVKTLNTETNVTVVYYIESSL